MSSLSSSCCSFSYLHKLTKAQRKYRKPVCIFLSHYIELLLVKLKRFLCDFRSRHWNLVKILPLNRQLKVELSFQQKPKLLIITTHFVFYHFVLSFLLESKFFWALRRKLLTFAKTSALKQVQCSLLISGSVNSEILLIQTLIMVPAEPIVLHFIFKANL